MLYYLSTASAYRYFLCRTVTVIASHSDVSVGPFLLWQRMQVVYLYYSVTVQPHVFERHLRVFYALATRTS